jgi:ABC-2 type transport system ATP-binding protein
MTTTHRIDRTPVIVADSVDKSFLRKHALRSASFSLSEGVVGLLGPNGAGKTTLLRILATVMAPDAGGVRVLGLDPSDAAQRLELRRVLGYLPQDPGFQRGFTAFEFVDYVAILKEWTHRRARHDEVRRVLSIVDLTADSGRRVRSLSGGMRRRVALAAAIIGDPRILLLDEPTVGLDPEQRLRFRDLLSRAGEGRTVLLSTHQTEDVSAMCAQVVVLHDGGVRFQGSPEQLAAMAAGRVWLADERDPTARLAWRTGDGQHRNLGNPPPGCPTLAPTLEDGYLLLVGSSTQEVPA